MRTIAKGNTRYVWYASGHMAMLIGVPTKRIELWRPWERDAAVYMPIDSPMFVGVRDHAGILIPTHRPKARR